MKKSIKKERFFENFIDAKAFFERSPGQIAYVATNLLDYPAHFDVNVYQDSAKDFCWAVMLNGIQENLVARLDVENQKIIVVNGKRRLMAANKLNITELPVCINIEQSDLRGLVSEVSRHRKTPLEKAVWYKEVMTSEGLNQKTLADHLGCTEACVSGILSLLNLTSEIQEQVMHDNSFTLTTLMKLARLDKDEQGKAFAALKVEKELTAISSKTACRKRSTGKSISDSITGLMKKLQHLDTVEARRNAIYQLQKLINELQNSLKEAPLAK